MTGPEDTTPRVIPAALIIHQEGAIALIALVGVWWRDDGFAAAFAARSSGLAGSLLIGVAAGLVFFGLLWLVRGLGPLRELESWQRQMVAGWSTGDALAVAVFSGLAEEAFIRALLQPLIGLVPAAAVFAVLHLVPDRRLWMWPVVALLLGVAIGWVFGRWGYPAAAAAHVVINGISLARFRALARS